MNTERQATFRHPLEGYAATADDNSPIVITVAPDKRPGRYRAYVGTEQEPLCVSRQPFLDGARKLLARGHDRRTILVMRWAGAKECALRGPLEAAAKLTVDEHNGTFAKWKPLSRSAVRPRIAKSADPVLGVRPAEKSAPGSTAEKVRRVPGDAPEARWDAAAQYLIEASE
jgi:hypothetical protein